MLLRNHKPSDLPVCLHTGERQTLGGLVGFLERVLLEAELYMFEIIYNLFEIIISSRSGNVELGRLAPWHLDSRQSLTCQR